MEVTQRMKVTNNKSHENVSSKLAIERKFVPNSALPSYRWYLAKFRDNRRDDRHFVEQFPQRSVSLLAHIYPILYASMFRTPIGDDLRERKAKPFVALILHRIGEYVASGTLELAASWQARIAYATNHRTVAKCCAITPILGTKSVHRCYLSSAVSCW